MMRKGRAIVTEFFVSPAKALFALDLWDAADIVPGDIVLPGPGRALLGAGGAVLRLGAHGREILLEAAILLGEIQLAARQQRQALAGKLEPKQTTKMAELFFVEPPQLTRVVLPAVTPVFRRPSFGKKLVQNAVDIPTSSGV